MEEQVTKERISLLCPVSHARMQRPGRSARCLHATAFCAAALPALKAGSTGLYRCPSCSITFAADELVTDVPLTLFLSEHPEATSCAVVRRSAAQGGWAYRNPSSKPPKPQRRSHAPGQLRHQPSETSEASSSDAPPRLIKLEDGLAVKAEPSAAPSLLETPAITQPQQGSAAARVAAQVEQHAAVHAAAPPCGARAPTAASSAAVRLPAPAAHWARGAAAAHVEVQAAAARAAALRSEGGSSSTARPAVAVAPGQPQKQSQEQRAARRQKRREDAKRAQLLARVKEVLIKRALHEEQPQGSGAGTCLWNEDSD